MHIHKTHLVLYLLQLETSTKEMSKIDVTRPSIIYTNKVNVDQSKKAMIHHLCITFTECLSFAQPYYKQQNRVKTRREHFKEGRTIDVLCPVKKA